MKIEKIYYPQGVCSRSIDLVISDGLVDDVRFAGGCKGNAQGISNLVKGRPVEEVISLLKGIDCGGKGTSCPDQLSKALQEVLDEQ